MSSEAANSDDEMFYPIVDIEEGIHKQIEENIEEGFDSSNEKLLAPSVTHLNLVCNFFSSIFEFFSIWHQEIEVPTCKSCFKKYVFWLMSKISTHPYTNSKRWVIAISVPEES